MHYFAGVYGREDIWSRWSAERMQRHIAAHREYEKALREAGVLVSHGPLPFSWEGKTVRVRGGKTLVTNGAAPVRLQLGGFYILECKDIDEAVGWAARMPNASLEVEENEVQVIPLTIEHFKSDEWMKLVPQSA
jgi:hypothetical protein